MTKNEVIKILKGAYSLLLQTRVKFEDVRDYKNASEEAIKALEEAHEYRKLGTVEEVREAVEKAKAKKPKTRHLKKYDGYNDGWCPCCNTYVQEFEYDKKYCQNCGQKLDWSVEE